MIGAQAELREIAQMTLEYRAKHDRPEGGKFGTYLGRGDGTIEGPRLAGTVVWDLYENQGPSACDVNVVGTIRTFDDAEIRFDVLGFFKRGEDDGTWSLSSAVRFSTDDARYACFDDCVGLITGTFDAASYSHRHRVFAPPCRG